jgi:hypothetical protein
LDERMVRLRVYAAARMCVRMCEWMLVIQHDEGGLQRQSGLVQQKIE